MKLVNQIQKHLMTAVEGNAYDILIPNFFYGGFEMDLFKIAHLTGYVTEYEIKISKADFKKDFSPALK